MMLLCCSAVVLLMLTDARHGDLCLFASFWPYNLTPSLRHYVLGLVDGEVGEGFVNSLKMAAGTAFGTLLVFFGAYPLEKTKGAPFAARSGAHARDAADGGARTGPGSWLHLLLQRAKTTRCMAFIRPLRS